MDLVVCVGVGGRMQWCGCSSVCGVCGVGCSNINVVGHTKRWCVAGGVAWCVLGLVVRRWKCVVVHMDVVVSLVQVVICSGA